MEKIENLSKGDLKGKYFNELIKELNLNQKEILALRERITNLDLTICVECEEICDNTNEVRYCGYDFDYLDIVKDEEMQGEAMCDRCFQVENGKSVELIRL